MEFMDSNTWHLKPYTISWVDISVESCHHSCCISNFVFASWFSHLFDGNTDHFSRKLNNSSHFSANFDVTQFEYSFSVRYYMMSMWPPLWDDGGFGLGGICGFSVTCYGSLVGWCGGGNSVEFEGSFWSKAPPPSLLLSKSSVVLELPRWLAIMSNLSFSGIQDENKLEFTQFINFAIP